MAKYRRGKDLTERKTDRSAARQGKLRIVGGKYRGRLIRYSGDPVTRPMKDHTREALFNLVGGWAKGKACFDLFAGSGAVGIESISRGASVAHLVERHIPTLRIIQENVRSIDPDMNVHIHGSDSFFWVRQFIDEPVQWPTEPWMVFCCPPYALFNEAQTEMLEMIGAMLQAAPAQSLIVVEANVQFDQRLLPDSQNWDTRQYAPALISVYKKN